VSPRLAGRSDNLVVGREDAVREVVGPQILPDVFDRVQLRGARRQQDRREVLRPVELAGDVPSGAIQQQHGMGTLGDVEGYLVDMQLHHVGVGMGQCEGRADTSGGADGAEQIRVLVALIGRLGGSCSTLRPLPDEAVLLADAGFILEPDLDRFAPGYAREMGCERAREVFLKAAMVSPSCIGCRGRALICEKPSSFRSLPTDRS
jgi:hypothetical protein